MAGGEGYLGSNYPGFPITMTPPGLQAIYNACRRLYPDQLNPLQVTALVKYWLGGPDPLDYISMYSSPGDPENNVPPHWHYVSFGLSDLHGDGRVHECTGPDGPSGFGFELTFRLKRENGETAPPTWPAALMQALARYVFQSENTLCAGDHIPWHSPLDGSESRIQHMLMTEDPQIQPLNTPLGNVCFVQIVGVCQEELKAAQHWNGSGIIEILSSMDTVGGPWLITDMRRGESIFEIDPQVQEQVDRGIEQEGSNLTGVTSRCAWEEPGGRRKSDDKENVPNGQSDDFEPPYMTDKERDQIKKTLKKGLLNSHPVLPPIKPETSESQLSSHTNHTKSRSRKHSFDSDAPTELMRTRVLDSVHLKFNQEAGALLPLALRGRLRHGRHFTFKSVVNEVAITFLSTSVVGSIADEQHPYAAHGPWLQVLLTDDFMDHMLEDMAELNDIDELLVPQTYRWPERRLMITISPDEV